MEERLDPNMETDDAACESPGEGTVWDSLLASEAPVLGYVEVAGVKSAPAVEE